MHGSATARNPLCDQGLGAVGPLRGCDPAAPHLTGCALVPVDQWPEQEPSGTWALWGVCGRRPSVWELALSADRTAVSGTRARPTGFSPWRPCQGCRGSDVLYQPASAASSGPGPQPWKPHQVLGGGAGLRAKAPGFRPRARALRLSVCPGAQSPSFLSRPGLCQQPSCTQLRQGATALVTAILSGAMTVSQPPPEDRQSFLSHKTDGP